MARNLKRRERQQSPCFSKWCYASPHSEHLTSFLIHTLSSLNQSSLLIIKIIMKGIMKGNGPRQPKDISPSCLPCPAPWKSLPSQRKPQSEDVMVGDCNSEQKKCPPQHLMASNTSSSPWCQITECQATVRNDKKDINSWK